MCDVLLMVPLPKLLKSRPNLPDLGLGYIASALINNNFSVEVLDWNTTFSVEEFKNYLLNSKPKVIAIKVFTVNIKGAFGTIDIIKSTLPEAIVVIGGPHPSTSDADVIFDEFPTIDFAFKGEVEKSFPEFLKLLKTIDYKRESFDSIKDNFLKINGLVWRNGNITQFNPPVMEEINSITRPAWELINPNNYLHPSLDRSREHVAPIITTRGCAFDCTFCCAYFINGKKIRRRDVADVVDEIEFINKNFTTSQFLIMDSSFTIDINYLLNFCDEIKKRNLQIKWDCIFEIMGNYNNVDLNNLFKNMYDAGCVEISLGIETASDKIKKSVKKDSDNNKIRDFIKSAKSNNIKVMGFFMFGFPEETEADVDETINFALKEPFDMVSFNICLPLPGTEMYSDLKKKYGFKRIDWANYSVANPPYQVSKVKPSVLHRKLCVANLKAEFRNGLKLNRNVLKWVVKYILNF